MLLQQARTIQKVDRYAMIELLDFDGDVLGEARHELLLPRLASDRREMLNEHDGDQTDRKHD